MPDIPETPDVNESIKAPEGDLSALAKTAPKPGSTDMPEAKDTHWSSKALRGITGLWHGPAATMGLSGVLGALAGRYVGAPLLSAAFLPGEDEIGEEEHKKRREKIKKIMTFLGAAPGILGGGAWGIERMSKHGPKGMLMGWKGENERLFGPPKQSSYDLTKQAFDPAFFTRTGMMLGGLGGYAYQRANPYDGPRIGNVGILSPVAALGGTGLGMIIDIMRARRAERDKRDKKEKKAEFKAPSSADWTRAVGMGAFPKGVITASKKKRKKKIDAGFAKLKRMHYDKTLLRKILKQSSFAGEPDPLNPLPQPAIPIAATMGLVYSDPYLTANDKQQFAGFMMEASQGQSRGILTTENLVKAGIGAGLGYAGANVASKVLGAVFGLSAPTKKVLRRTGMIAGALYGAGIIQ